MRRFARVDWIQSMFLDWNWREERCNVKRPTRLTIEYLSSVVDNCAIYNIIGAIAAKPCRFLIEIRTDFSVNDAEQLTDLLCWRIAGIRGLETIELYCEEEAFCTEIFRDGKVYCARIVGAARELQNS